MLITLLIGCATVIVTLAIQISAVVQMLKYLFRVLEHPGVGVAGSGKTTYVISIVMTMLFLGHMVQVATWAVLFMQLGEFSDFQTAFYHSMVNFTSLGYGDIVMSEQWRLMGSIEASAGVLMFGLSAGTMLSIMNFILVHDTRVKDRFAALKMKKDQNA